ncbi:MAG: hypothetical protein WCK63_16190 [Betaproteobacteria bacterium]
MPHFTEHCRQAIEIFGIDYAVVHRWLDEFACTSEYGFRHRSKRHHEAGIREAARLFGPEAGAAARQHIIADLQEEGWTAQDHFPQDEADYVRMGLF